MRYVFLFCFVLMVFFSPPTRAEIIMIRDVGSEITLTTPDDWDKALPAIPSEKITAVAPGNAARLTVGVEPDRRFVVYPPPYAPYVQRAAIDAQFWQDYWASRYDKVNVLYVRQGTGLGRAYAGFAQARFTPLTGPDAGQVRRGIVAAGIYAGKLTTAECSSAESVWSDWEPTCTRIFDTLTHRAVDHAFRPQGYYRDFMKDKPLSIEGPRPIDVRLR